MRVSKRVFVGIVLFLLGFVCVWSFFDMTDTTYIMTEDELYSQDSMDVVVIAANVIPGKLLVWMPRYCPYFRDNDGGFHNTTGELNVRFIDSWKLGVCNFTGAKLSVKFIGRDETIYDMGPVIPEDAFDNMMDALVWGRFSS